MASSSYLITLLVSCLFSLSLASISSIEANKNVGITLDLIHRDSALSPSYDPSLTRFERLRKSIDRSYVRKESLTQVYLRATSATPSSFDTTIVPDGGSYLMKYNLGTPPKPIIAIADTGSDLIWTQCEPCTCYDQTAPLFDSRLSSTYKTADCGGVCSQNQFTCTSKKKCSYQYGYGDGSYTKGDIATETLTFTSSNGVKTSFHGIYIGCGRNNAGTFSPSGSGIVGLGGGPLSIVKQAGNAVSGKFSYCMTQIGTDKTSKLKFGTDAVVTGHGVVSTPLVNKDPDTFYYLTLKSVSVAGATRFTTEPTAAENPGNIIIDSGTTLTYLPSAMCYGLLTGLVNAINSAPLSDPPQGFALCYNLDDLSGTVPAVVLHFQGADVEVKPENYLLEVAEGVVCVTFVPSDDLAIFGNLHQTGYHIGYDLVKRVVNFKRTDCTKV